MRGIVARQVQHRAGIGQFVDRDNSHLPAQRAFVQRAQDTATDAAVAIDSQTQHEDQALQQHVFDRRDNVVGREAKVLHQRTGGRGFAERRHADHAAVEADVLVPVIRV